MEPKKHSLWSNMRYVYKKVFHYNKKLTFQIPLQMFCELLAPVIGTIVPATAVGLITNGKSIRDFLLVLGGITFCYMIILFTKQYLYNVINIQNTLVRIKEFYLNNVVKLMTTDYINVEPQEKQLIIQRSINSLESNWVGPEFMMKNTPVFITNFIGLIIYGTMISILDLKIILVLTSMAILNIALTNYARSYEEKHKKDYVKYDRQISYLYDNSTSLINGKDVRIYQMEAWFYQLFKTLIKKRISWSTGIELRYFMPSLSDNILLFIRDFIAYGILITKTLNGEMDAAMFTLFVGIMSGFSNWLQQSVNAYSNLRRANLGVNDFRAYDEIEEVFRHNSNTKPLKKSKHPLTIEFKKVSFRYPGAEKDTITNLSLKIDGGEKIALVGINGAGKTTLVKLLSGLYYPTKGDILINGQSIKDYDIEEYHKLIGAVFQDVEILAFSIAKNVAACKEDEIDYKKVRYCLELAGLMDKVNGLKDKENTYLTQNLSKDGIMLSGGEMQKLMLARAIYKDAPIMILDEPTAALDPIAESELYEKYNNLTKNKTSLFISHRLSSTKFCDRIVFLENGQIVESGTHDELMRFKGKYANMYDIQSHYYKENLEVKGYEEEIL
jgi:ATP-binding cassette, subfamily B, bacterial